MCTYQYSGIPEGQAAIETSTHKRLNISAVSVLVRADAEDVTKRSMKLSFSSKRLDPQASTARLDPMVCNDIIKIFAHYVLR